MEDADLSAAELWLAHDPDPADRAELRALLDASAAGDQRARQEVADRMASPLSFGTAGLRGAMAAGSNRMNTAVVTTASAGLAAVLKSEVGSGFKVVVGYDARHRSADFARTAAGVFVAAGGEVYVMPRPLPTPLTAFAIRRLEADAAVMVTASHNPAADNGYKVYVGGRMTDQAVRGAQIVPPMDAQIESAIRAVGWADEVAVADQGWTALSDSIVEDYLAATLATRDERLDLSELRIVLTAMHGVGYDVCEQLLQRAGVGEVIAVEAQRDPDPDFTTVSFPNPEEAGALDLAFETAQQADADLIIALDPDADRCAVAIVSPQAKVGWRQLSGDELGGLLGEFMAQRLEGQLSGPPRSLARSIVSSSLLDSIADRHGLPAEQTLTGFKWIARATNIGYGYEEAIGYCVNPEVVKDKDGISTALLAAQLAAQTKAARLSMQDRLDALAMTHGLHATAPLTFRVDELSKISDGLQRLKTNPPVELAGSPVIEFADLADGWRGLPPTPGFRIETEASDRIIVRPSGTEPKLKCYLEVVESVTTTIELAAARERTAQRLAQISEQLREILGF